MIINPFCPILSLKNLLVISPTQRHIQVQEMTDRHKEQSKKCSSVYSSVPEDRPRKRVPDILSNDGTVGITKETQSKNSEKHSCGCLLEKSS